MYRLRAILVSRHKIDNYLNDLTRLVFSKAKNLNNLHTFYSIKVLWSVLTLEIVALHHFQLCALEEGSLVTQFAPVPAVMASQEV